MIYFHLTKYAIVSLLLVFHYTLSAEVPALKPNTTAQITNSTTDTTAQITNSTTDTTAQITNSTTDTTAQITNSTTNTTPHIPNPTDNTTVMPNSTTTVCPTTVSPVPLVPTYIATNGTKVCLVVQMDLELRVHYYNTSGNLLPVDLYLNSTHLPTTVNGTCGFDEEELLLQWNSSEMSSWSIKMIFGKNSKDYFDLSRITLNYTVDNVTFPGTNETGLHRVGVNNSLFTSSIGSYYQCLSRQTVILTKDPAMNVTQPEVSVVLKNLKVEAFRNSSSSIFDGSMTECYADVLPNKVIPIVVGVALGVMIIVALLVFIIGSRRRQTGYQEI